jgi:putative ATPase
MMNRKPMPLIFPDELKGSCYYEPVNRGLEIKIGEKLKHLKELDKNSGK